MHKVIALFGLLLCPIISFSTEYPVGVNYEYVIQKRIPVFFTSPVDTKVEPENSPFRVNVSGRTGAKQIKDCTLEVNSVIRITKIETTVFFAEIASVGVNTSAPIKYITECGVGLNKEISFRRDELNNYIGDGSVRLLKRN